MGAKKKLAWAAGFLILILTGDHSPTPPTQFSLTGWEPHANLGKSNAAIQARVADTYGKLPLSFAANQGQWDSQVKFLSLGPGYTLFLTPGEAVLSLSKPGEPNTSVEGSTEPDAEHSQPTAPALIRMQLVGANTTPQIMGLEELPGESNYFVGNDPTKWRTNMPTYAKVKYEDVYTGVDLVYYGNQRQLEYDFIVAPGKDPAVIKLGFEGVSKLELETNGDLVLYTVGAQVRQRKPLIYQEVKGVKQEIIGSYVLKGRHQVGFQISNYDASRPLVIDPTVVYFDKTGAISVVDITVDADGNAYVTGPASVTFPIVNPLQPNHGGGGGDAFVAKLDPSGSAFVYSTFLGGSGDDGGRSIAVDADGNTYVAGTTCSTNFPTAKALQQASGGPCDAFVAKLNPSGSELLYSTYLGGSLAERADGIAVDGNGNAYVVGATTSTDFNTAFPLQPGFGGGGQDVFVAKLDPAGLVYSTYLGGSGLEFEGDIAVDANGNAYVSGSTRSTDFPTANPLQPAFSGGSQDAF
ncbi:SBBP repeat-containing protein, partial [Acidobacteria bacterium AH-259-D05]|nr:SBBP repeat-containing protein [Acidobacteria bacterium AH-259-D05]